MLPTDNPTAQLVDGVMIYIFGLSLLLLLGITIVTIYFVVKYRRSRHPEPTSDVDHNIVLEAVWTVLPTLIVLTMFWYGWVNYVGLTEVPEDAIEVKATARMWSWQFEYEDGRRENRLYVPANTPVKVRLQSTDVIHSFFVPAFRIKKDMVPGLETYVWFEAPKPGSYDIFCTEYCGVGHADMVTTIEALSAEDYAAWLVADAPPEHRGLVVMREQGCIGCHSVDGTTGIGPSLFELAGSPRRVEIDGQTTEITIDDDYLVRAIRHADYEVVQGYPAMMPSYDEATLNQEDLQALVDYMMDRPDTTTAPVFDGARLIEINGCIGCHSTDGSRSIGPTFQGIGSRDITFIRDGQEFTQKADADYLLRALVDPGSDMVKGYPDIMPPMDYLSPEELDAIVDHLLQQ
ncbi:MAG: cytochrome c oxidase subunit II [Desulfuromonadales bacterium]|nr:cytochrome c oxidase subunit II [Desulfuromonadales bacterium]